jgi:hypothetical protein
VKDDASSASPSKPALWFQKSPPFIGYARSAATFLANQILWRFGRTACYCSSATQYERLFEARLWSTLESRSLWDCPQSSLQAPADD